MSFMDQVRRGRPSKVAHIQVDIVREKACSSCLQVKPKDQFYKHKHTADGRSSYCKDCIRGRTRTYMRNNREVVKQRRETFARIRARLREEAMERLGVPDDQVLVVWDGKRLVACDVTSAAAKTLADQVRDFGGVVSTAEDIVMVGEGVGEIDPSYLDNNLNIEERTVWLDADGVEMVASE